MPEPDDTELSHDSVTLSEATKDQISKELARRFDLVVIALQNPEQGPSDSDAAEVQVFHSGGLVSCIGLAWALWHRLKQLFGDWD